MSPDAVEKMFREVDTACDGTISYGQYLCVLFTKKSKTPTLETIASFLYDFMPNVLLTVKL